MKCVRLPDIVEIEWMILEKFPQIIEMCQQKESMKTPGKSILQTLTLLASQLSKSKQNAK